MAEILIKNMEMPKSCLGELNGKNDCPIVGICGIFKATPFKEKENIVWEQRLKDCPLVEVPTHGVLWDRDKIFNVFNERIQMYRELGYKDDDFIIQELVHIQADLIAKVDTVIEASKERE